MPSIFYFAKPKEKEEFVIFQFISAEIERKFK